MELNGKVVLITGGTQGIGYAIALRCGRAGAQVVITGREQAKTEAAAQKLASECGREVLGIACDVAKSSDVETLFEKVLDKLKRVDVLVNNAGITKDNLILRMSEKDFDDVVATNLKGAFLCSKSASKVMVKQRSGVMINISSIVGVVGNPGQANYASTKAALVGLSKSLAKELGSRNVRVNVVAPGYVHTSMTDELSEESRKEFLKSIPLGRFCEPEEIAEAVLFLASDTSRYVTGQVLRVDGGMMM